MKHLILYIEAITYDVKNGMCQISLIMKEPEVKKVAITRLNAPQIGAPAITEETMVPSDIMEEDKPISRKRRFNK